MTALVVLSAIALGAQLLAMAALAFNWKHAPDIAAEPMLDGTELPQVLALVPARNEAKNITACVRALRASAYPRLAVRVIDDGSTDGTGELARAAGAEVIAAGDLPAGWLGKNHALHVGTRGATADYLLFVDADLRVAPECVPRLIALAQRTSADLVSILPRVETVTFWERAAQALVAQIIYAWLPARDINDPEKKAAAGTGPCMLFRRQAYERIGGHEAVRAEVVEDLRLAERTKAAGGRLVYGRGVELASLRMYDSLRAIVRGWSKNFHVAFGRATFLAPIMAAGVLLVYGGPYLLPLVALALAAWKALAVAGAAAVVAILARLDAHRRYRLDVSQPYLAALGAGVVAWILLRAASRRPVEWKGRSVH